MRYPGLEGHPTHQTARHYHPRGLYGALVGFGIKGGLESGRQFVDELKIFSLLANIGDAKSLIIHPASTIHSLLREAEQYATGVSPEFVRLSVGIETVDDLLADLNQAWRKYAKI